jgi:hypothetical protein
MSVGTGVYRVHQPGLFLSSGYSFLKLLVVEETVVTPHAIGVRIANIWRIENIRAI